MSLRRLPISAAALAAVAVLGLAACGDTKTKTVTVTATPTSATNAESGKTVNIIASVPPTDHGWLGAISKNAKAAAAQHPDVKFKLLQAADADSQAQQVEQAISQKPDALVVLPQDGAALTPVAQKAERAGIPVVNIDRLFTKQDAATATILGDNYQIGVLAADYIADQRHPARARRDRRRGHRRDEPRRRAGDDLRDVPGGSDLRDHLQPHDAAEPFDRGTAGDQGTDRPRGRPAAAPGGALLIKPLQGGMSCR